MAAFPHKNKNSSNQGNSRANQGNSLSRASCISLSLAHIALHAPVKAWEDQQAFVFFGSFVSLFVCSKFGDARPPRRSANRFRQNARQWQRCGAAATSFDQMPAKAPLDASQSLAHILFATSLPGVLTRSDANKMLSTLRYDVQQFNSSTWTRKGKPTKTKKMTTSRTRTLQKTPRPRLQTASGSSGGRHTRRADLSGRRSPHWGSWRAGNEAGNNHRYQIQGFGGDNSP